MMVKFQRLIIMAVILLGFNFKANAELVVESNGRVRVSTGGFNQNGVRTWRYLDNGRGGMGGNMFYHETSSKSLAVREASTGLRSASTVPVTIEQKVSRSTVLRNLLSKAKIGGKFARVGGGPVGFAVSTAAFYLVEQMLADEGYVYDVKKSDFVTDKEYKYRLKKPVYDKNFKLIDWEELQCVGLGVESYNLDKKGASHLRPYRDAMCQRHWQTLMPQYRPEDGYKFKTSDYRDCYIHSPKDSGRSAGKFTWEKMQTQSITQQEFDRIVGPNADRNPTPYVNATANEDGSIPGASVSTPSVPNGTVITLGPATGQDGRPFQITISFTTGADGNTTATVTTTTRPDLTPGSPAAPKTNPTPTPGENGKPGGQPNPNPDGSPGSQPDPTPDGSPSDKTKPDPDGSPSGKDKPDPNNTPEGKDDPKPDDKPKEDEKPKEDGGLLCEVFPNILACDKMGKPEEGMFDAISIPQTTDDRTWSSDDFLPPNGVCPQPKSFNIWGRPVQISYEPLCVFMQNIRFAVLLGFIIMSAFIVFGSLRKG